MVSVAKQRKRKKSDSEYCEVTSNKNVPPFWQIGLKNELRLELS